MSGGEIRDNLYGYNNSQLSISGGSIDNAVWLSNNSQLDFSGGTITGYFHAGYDTQAVFSGGTVGVYLRIYDSSVVTIEGSGFAVDGESVDYGELTSTLGGSHYDETARRLTGTLANGDVMDNDFYIGNTAKIVLIHEPAADFDSDGDVDGIDFGLWQIGYPTASGASLSDGDTDYDGDVDGTDFAIWQDNYPTNVGGAAIIPEPATLLVLGLGGLALLIRNKR